MSEQFAKVGWHSHDGLPLYARVYAGPDAGAPTVLCLHGLTRNRRDFEDPAPPIGDALRAATFARMKSENPGLQQFEVANRGHVPLLDERECIAALDTFLARILSAPPA